MRQAFPQGQTIGLIRGRLGRALVTLSRPAEAEPELLEAQKILLAAGDLSLDHHRRCLTDLIALYESWERTEPGKGHDAQARSWKEKLAAREADAKPAAESAAGEQVK